MTVPFEEKGGYDKCWVVPDHIGPGRGLELSKREKQWPGPQEGMFVTKIRMWRRVSRKVRTQAQEGSLKFRGFCSRTSCRGAVRRGPAWSGGARRRRQEERPSPGSEEWVPDRAYTVPQPGQEAAQVIQEKESMRR